MTHSNLSRWLRRGAFTVVACAAIAMVSADQANAQYYGGRGGSFGGGRGISLSIGNGGYGRGQGFSGRSYSRGGSSYGGRSNFNSGYRYVPQKSYYRGGGGYYGGGSSYSRGGGGYQSRSYSRGRY